MTLKEFILKNKKEVTYELYHAVSHDKLPISKVTKNQMYDAIIKSYIDKPEIILNMLSTEQITILRDLIDEKEIANEDNGYLMYTVLKGLLLNHFIFANKEKYYIPEDLINPIKMALNIYSEKEYINLDIANNVILGLIRIYNIVKLDDFLKYLNDYDINIKKDDFKKYCAGSFTNKDKIAVKKYRHEEYVISLEMPTYKDIFDEINQDIEPYKFMLDEVVSIGKYRINLFDQNIIDFISFLEMHLPSFYVEKVIKEISLYSGFGLDNDDILKSISGNIEALYQELKKAYPSFPCWIYKGWPQKRIKEK